MATVNKRSPLIVTAAFTDENDSPVTPTTVEWRLDDITLDKEILDWASLSPATSITFVIPGTNHVINDEDNIKEIRAVTIRIDDGLATEAHEEFRYSVLNRAPTEET